MVQSLEGGGGRNRPSLHSERSICLLAVLEEAGGQGNRPLGWEAELTIPPPPPPFTVQNVESQRCHLRTYPSLLINHPPHLLLPSSSSQQLGPKNPSNKIKTHKSSSSLGRKGSKSEGRRLCAAASRWVLVKPTPPLAVKLGIITILLFFQFFFLWLLPLRGCCSEGAGGP